MRRTVSSLFVVVAFAVMYLIAPEATLAQNAYITNRADNTVSVIDTAHNVVIATIPVGRDPYGVAVTPDGSKVYVTDYDFNEPAVSVISTSSNKVIATIPVGRDPNGVAVTPDGSKVYVANLADDTVSVINTETDAVIGSPIPVGIEPSGVAVTPDGSNVYVTNAGVGGLGEVDPVSVIDTTTETVIATIPVGRTPVGVAVTPDGSKVYVGNENDSTVSVIGTAADTVIKTITGFRIPFGVAVTPDGSKVYVSNDVGDTVSVIGTATNAVIARISENCAPLACAPAGLAVTPDGSEVYVANSNGGVDSVSVIDTATNTVMGSPIPVGGNATAFGLFIQPKIPMRFAGRPGKPNCFGQSVSALARQYVGLYSAAAALGYPSVPALQDTILEFCEPEEAAGHGNQGHQ